MTASIKNLILLVIGTGLIQSCKVTKDYSRPELGLPTVFRGMEADSMETVEVPAYQQFFTDANLIELLDRVMENNADLLMASEQVLASEALLKSTKLNYLPEISMQVGSGLQRLSENSMTGSFAGGLLFEEYNLALVTSWEIDFLGKLKRQREEALANYLGHAENRRALRVQLIAQTAQAYYNLLSLDEQLRITLIAEKNMQEMLEMLKTQFSVGEATSLAVQQSSAQLAETRALIPEIKASIEAQENMLQTQAGSYPDSIKRIGSLENRTFGTILHAGIPASLLSNRPDVKQQELRLMAANARMGIAKTAFYPSVTITGQGGLNAIKASNWFSIPSSLFGTVAGGIAQPVFNRRSIKSAYEEAVHQREAAVHEFRKSMLVAVEEVATSLSNMGYIEEQMAQVNSRKEAMNKAINDAQLLYQYGDANYLEVLTVQQSYLQTELAYITLMQKQINAYIAIYKSLGGN